MSKLAWKTLGLAALVAGGLQLATMGGATALTMPVPASPGVDTTPHWNGQLQQVYTKKQYPTKKSYPKKSYPKKSYHKKPYHSGKKHYYHKKYPHWHYNKHRYGHRYRGYRPGYGYYYGGYWYSRPWWTFTVPVPAPAPSYSAHVQWCLNHYRSYNPRTDMFLGYDGYYHHCHSPYQP